MSRRSVAAARQLVHPRYNFLQLDYWFGRVDSRPLSLFRICLAALLLKNALYSIPLAHLFYSDAGIVPRARFWDDPAGIGLGHFSLLNYFSASWVAILVFIVWAGIALALLVGYRTRLMAVLNYLLMLSIIHRNPLILTGADRVMTVLSFWMIFLPLNHDYSVDAWLARRHRQPMEQGDNIAVRTTPHTTYAFPLRVIQIQVALIYIFTSYMKWHGGLWREGIALFYTFQQDGFLLPTGVWFAEIAPPWLLRLLTWSTLLIEAGFALLVFSPVLQPWARASGLLLAGLLHLGIAVTMDIPDFSIVMWISYILFFEPTWVVWLERQVRRLLKRSPAPIIVTQAVVQPEERRRLMPAIGQLALTIVLALLLTITIWGGLGREKGLWSRLAPTEPGLVQAINQQLHLGAAWQMFVYRSIPRSGWLMIYGQFEDGANPLLYTGADPTTGQMYRQWGPGARLRLFEQHLIRSFPESILRSWAGYYCRLYNLEQNHPSGRRLATVDIHLMYRISHLPGRAPNPLEDDLLWRHRCFPEVSGRAVSQQGPDFHELDRVALAELKEASIPGAAVAIVSGDRVVYAKGFGVSNLETNAPVTADMLFRSGSTGKMFTAAVLATLAEEGKLRLDEPVGRYVKGLSSAISRLIVHQMLTHTAGLKDDGGAYGPHDESALAQTVRSWNEDAFFLKPGEIFSYSNPGYALAGYMIEELSGKPYAKAMEERLFRPLGMTRTTFQPTVAMTYPLAQGHDGDSEGLGVLRPANDHTVYWPAGFEYTSVQDLARFAIAFMNDGKIEGKQVLLPSVIAKLSTPYVAMHSSPGSYSIQDGKYGYGTMIHTYRGVRIVEHGGVIPGYGCRLLMVPEQRFAVIALTNRTGTMLNRTVEKAMELMLPLKPKPEQQPNKGLPISEAEMANYVGTYKNPSNSAMEIVIRDGKLFFTSSGDQFPLKKIADRLFAVVTQRRFQYLEFVPVPGADGKVLYWHRGLRAWKRVQTDK
jgi:CubicO group peptidase (beta-lactamase class C family)